jgi:hypothetical protein
MHGSSYMTVLKARPVPTELDPVATAARIETLSVVLGNIIRDIEGYVDALRDNPTDAEREAADQTADRLSLHLLSNLGKLSQLGQQLRELVGYDSDATAGPSKGDTTSAGRTDSVGRDFDALALACAAEYKMRPALAAEFGDLETFIAYRRADARGCVRILSKGTPGSAGGAVPSDASLRREWDTQAALRREFGGDFAAFAAFRQAEARGLVGIYAGERGA